MAFIKAYDEFERALPSWPGARLPGHPRRAGLHPHRSRIVINAPRRPRGGGGLTWTDNDAADPEAVSETLEAHLGPAPCPGVILGGPPPVADRFALRSGGRYVQIHDVLRMQAALLIPWRPFDPVSGIIELG
jgi:hypothetical protein